VSREDGDRDDAEAVLGIEPKALVVPLGVVVRHELRHRAPTVTLPEGNHAIQALLFDRADNLSA
jgi:hypothetical protein